MNLHTVLDIVLVLLLICTWARTINQQKTIETLSANANNIEKKESASVDCSKIEEEIRDHIYLLWCVGIRDEYTMHINKETFDSLVSSCWAPPEYIYLPTIEKFETDFGIIDIVINENIPDGKFVFVNQ